MVDDGNGNLVRACVKGGMASVESHGKQMAKGGIASIEKKRKSPPRDADFKMADGSAPENDPHQQMTGPPAQSFCRPGPHAPLPLPSAHKCRQGPRTPPCKGCPVYTTNTPSRCNGMVS
jgi:hypothetical protein